MKKNITKSCYNQNIVKLVYANIITSDYVIFKDKLSKNIAMPVKIEDYRVYLDYMLTEKYIFLHV